MFLFFSPRAPYFAALALCSMGTAVRAVDVHIAAIQPTTPGQIGVNLVDPIPSPGALIGKIGKNTEYLTEVGSSTSWKGSDPSFITKTTNTVTNTAGAVATITQGANVAVTENANGDFNILLGPALRASLIDIAKTIPACVAKKTKKRQSGACGYVAFTEAIAANGPLQAIAEIEGAMPAGRLVIPANDIAQLVALFRTGATTVSPAAVVGAGTLGILWIIFDQYNTNHDIAPALDVPSSVAGTTTTTKTTTTATSTSSQACPTSTDEPSCPDDDCKGGVDNKCTDNKRKGCPCYDINFDISTDIPIEWIGIQALVQQITFTTDSRPVPECKNNNKVPLDAKLWKAITSNICASQPLDADISAVQTAKDVGFTGYDGWTFAMNWKVDKGDCIFGCERMFIAFLGDSQCSYDSHTFSGSGKITEGCGTASFVVNQPIGPKPPSSQAPDPPKSTQAPAPPPGPALNVPVCGTGLSFQRSDAAESAKNFCKKLTKDSAWNNPQGLKFMPKVKIYNTDGKTINSGKDIALQIISNAAWCPPDMTLEMLPKKITVDRCFANFLTGIDGCAPFTAQKGAAFLKLSGLSYEDCLQWQISIVDV